MGDSRASAHDLPYWRERILRALLVSTCWFGAVAYVPSVWLAVVNDLWVIVVADTIVYASVVGITLWPRLSSRVRAWTMTALAYALGVVLIVVVGIAGSGLIWLACAPVFAAIVLGLRAAIRMLVLNACTMAALLGAMAADLFHYAPDTLFADGGFANFVVGAANASLLSTAVAWSIGSLLRGLEESQAQLRKEIDDRIAAMAERERLEQQLREAHKLEAVGRLASGIAHDFNNLLVPILGNAEELQRHAAPGSHQASALADIVTSAERGRSLVDRVLTFSRRASTPPSPVRLADVVRDAVQLLRAGLPPSIELVQALGELDAIVMADPIELHQVVMNLGTNAAYAMRDRGGRLTFGLVADPGGDSVTLHVRDTGTGMTPEVRARACEPFFTTKPAGEGSGLGLATVHAVVASLEGRLAIDSMPGKGTVVSITLPRLRGEVPAESLASMLVPAAAPAPRAARHARVLIVDDEPLVLKLCATVLTRMGYAVTAIGDPQEAATYVVERASEIDLLLTDKTMPGFSGLELSSLARTANPSLPIVLATGFLDDAARVEAAAMGITRVIAKPYRAADLGRAVRDALEARAKG